MCMRERTRASVVDADDIHRIALVASVWQDEAQKDVREEKYITNAHPNLLPTGVHVFPLCGRSVVGRRFVNTRWR